jgi:hypothetical protein
MSVLAALPLSKTSAAVRMAQRPHITKIVNKTCKKSNEKECRLKW